MRNFDFSATKESDNNYLGLGYIYKVFLDTFKQ